MRIYPLLFLFLPALLVGCAKTDAPVRLAFIGRAGLVSGNQKAAPNDTLLTRAYAAGLDHALAHLRITVKYEPTRNPILYPVPVSGYDPKNTPDDNELVYLDSVLVIKPSALNPNGREAVFSNRFTARATSGTELWRYTVTDAKGQSTSRAYRLTVRKPDSLAVFHSYAVLLRPVPRGRLSSDSLRRQARVYLNLHTGLLLPRYALFNQQNAGELQANQPLVDLVCTATGAALSLGSPTADSVGKHLPLAKWPQANRRATQLRQTTLTAANFDNAKTTAAFTAAFTGGSVVAGTSGLATGALAKGSVVAFKTAGEYYGLLLVTDLTTGTRPLLSCSIRVQKQ